MKSPSPNRSRRSGISSAKTPLILISPSFSRKGAEFADASVSVSNRYAEAVLAAGGLPLILPGLKNGERIAQAVSRADGVLLTGGNDVQPGLYGADLDRRLRRTVGPSDALRDFLELILIAEALRQIRPILAICRGLQLLNVALGGTLLADIARQKPGTLRHERSDAPEARVHEVTLTPGSLLAKITGTNTMRVNSSHHQAAHKIAPSLQVTALSPDGIVEGLEWKEAEKNHLPWMQAVQFHPERLFEQDENSFQLFRKFISASAQAPRQRL